MAATPVRGGNVHHVERGAGHALGEPQNAAEAEVLRQPIMDLGEILEADPAFADQLGVHVHDDVVVLGVDDAEAALLRQHLERFPDVAEVDHAAGAGRQDVGGEDLQRRVAGLDRFGELPGKLGRRLGVQHEVVGPVARALADEIPVARLDGVAGGRAIAPVGEIDERGGAAEQRRAADLLWPRGDERRAVGLDPHVMQVDMRVDAARHDDASAGVDLARAPAAPRARPARYRGDGLAGDRDVALDDALGRDDVTATNDDVEHAASRRFGILAPPQRPRNAAGRANAAMFFNTNSDPRTRRSVQPGDEAAGEEAVASRAKPSRETSGRVAHSPAS